jgi:hypothetical protein
MMGCAGILIRAPGPRYLVLERAENGVWECPAGHIEEGESPLEAAIRETQEEIGYRLDGPVWEATTSKTGKGEPFTLFVQNVPGEFTPKPNEEFVAWDWVTSGTAPPSIHPSLLAAMQALEGTETDIAQRMVDGALSSPQFFKNSWLFNLRITGTGVSYRPSLNEYVYRPPEVYLTDSFLKRCNGLPVIFLHPQRGERNEKGNGALLDSETFQNQSIGSVTLPYIKGEDVWGIARIYDLDAARLMLASHRSTSPAVDFGVAGSTESITLPDGSKLLLEGNPDYIDHLAVCENGVWDKGGEPSGISTPSGETTVENENESQAPAWADAMMKRMDDICGRMDAIDGRKDARKDESKEEKDKVEEKDHREERKDESNFDKLEDKLEDKGMNADYARKVAAKVGDEKIGKEEMAKRSAESREKHEREDSERKDARKDSENEEAKKEGREERKFEEKALEAGKREEKAEERADSATVHHMKQEIARLQERLQGLTRAPSMEERDELAQVQRRADSVLQQFGEHAEPPLIGESVLAYKQRQANRLKKYCPQLKSVRLDSLEGPMFEMAEKQIYADAIAAASKPAALPKGRLQAIVDTSSGHRVTTYRGDPEACWGPFKAPGFVGRINKDVGKRMH